MTDIKPIPGFEGLYEISDAGVVYSCMRFVAQRNGCQRLQRRKALRATAHTGRRSSYLKVCLRKGGSSHHRYVHRLVLLAFVGMPPFDGAQVRHLDGDWRNNTLYNLAYGSQEDNEADKKRTRRVRQTDEEE